jgi:hypothetical protein
LEGQGKPSPDNQERAESEPQVAASWTNELTNPNARDSHTNSNSDKKHPLDWWIFIFLVFTFIATATAACYTRKQWITADDSEKRSLRAYVMPFQMALKLTPDNHVSATVIIKNFGQTPARHFRGWDCLAVRDFVTKDAHLVDPTDLPPWPNSDKLSSLTLAQGDTTTVSPVYFCDGNDGPINRILTTDEVASVRGNSKAIYIYGNIKYDDVFGNPHWTNYRRLSSGRFGLGDGTLINAEEGNNDE